MKSMCWARALAVGLVVAAAAGAGPRAQVPGETWQRIGLIGGNVTVAAASPSFDADGTLFAGLSGAGLWRSTDGGETWDHLPAIPDNATVRAILFHPGYRFGAGDPMYVGLSSGDVFMSDSDFDAVTFHKQLTDRYGTLVPVTGGTLRDAQELFWGTSGGGVFLSTDWGQSYTNISQEVASTLDCRAIAASKDSGKVLAACYRDKQSPVYEWISGQTWTVRNISGLTGEVPTALHIALSDPNMVFLGTATRGLWRSTDKGVTWSAACDGATSAQPYSVGAVAACPNMATDGDILEGRSDGLRLSTDRGLTCSWEGLSASVTSISYNLGYHRGGRCYVFVGTTAGLFLRSCQGPPQRPPDPPDPVAVQAVALAGLGPSGTWAGSNVGILRNIRSLFFLQYNASGAFSNQNPDVVALCLTPGYRPNGTCGTDGLTVFVAERTRGVFRSRDNGATWTQLNLTSQSVPTWPAGVTVNDLAIAPNYATGQANREILYAGTSAGLYRWDGPSTGWARTNGDFPIINVTRVAVPPTYDMTGASGLPNHLVVIATDNYTDPKTGRPVGLLFSDNDGARYTSFERVIEQDIVSIGFAPGYLSSGSRQLFFASPSKGVSFTDAVPSAEARFCAFNAGLDGRLRDVDVASQLAPSGLVRLVAATVDGPYYCDFDPGNSSDVCTSTSYAWRPSTYNTPPSGCRDTLVAAFAFLGDGRAAALGTSQDGVCFTFDGGETFKDWGTGYRSLPDDVYNVLPHKRDDRIVFAASPLYGAFVSRDKGASFRPWNAGGTGGPCVLNAGYGLGMMTDRVVSGTDVVWVGHGTNSGIKYRLVTYDATNGIQLDGDHWTNTNVTTGRFERFETLGAGQQAKARATSPTLGFYTVAANDVTNWAADNAGLPDLTAKSVRYGYDGLDTLPLTSGQPVASTVGQGLWKYYTLQVPPDTGDIRFFLDDPDNMGSVDPDMYIRYGALPTTTLFDYRPYINGDETVCVLPSAFTLLNETFEGTWGPNGDVPPAGWLIYDFGDEAVKTWNTNDWYKFAKGGAYGNVARVYYSPLENQHEWLVTPAFDIPAGALTATLEFDHYFRQYTGSTVVQYGRVWYGSNQRGWTQVAEFSADTANMAHATFSLLPYRGDTGARLIFQYVGYNGWYWEVDNVKISGTALSVGTWYVGVRGYASGSSPFELTATLDSGCTAFAAPPSGEGKDLSLARAARFEKSPWPEAPSSGTIWGTVSRSGGGGVYRGVDSTPFAESSGGASPATITWEARNGTGAGTLANLLTQCVLQLPDLTLVAGCNGGVFYSPGPDEGRTTWVESTGGMAGACSHNFTDLLECSNGDILIAANGTTDGGTWLSGDKGRHWMRISHGFDSTSQQIEDLVDDEGMLGEVSYYAGTDATGAYTRTITAAPYPTVTGLSPSTGSANGGETVTITGTGFVNLCPTGESADCPDSGPVVLFDDVEAPSTTYLNGSTLTCVTPPHVSGTAVVRVRNRDTRLGGSRTFTFSCATPSSLTNSGAADLDCGDTGVRITWAADPASWGDGGAGTRTYDVLRNGAAIASGLANGTTGFTDTTGTNGVAYTYTVLYRNGCGVTATTTGASAADFVTPGTPAITSITDESACAQSGIRIYFTGGAGASQHALYRNGALAVANYKAGDLYNPGSTTSYSYVVRALAGTTCSADSGASASADGNATPGAPGAPAVSDLDPFFQSGVQISWGAVTGATGYDLQVDGTTLVAGVTSPYTHNPGNTASHAYQVRAKNACTGAWSAGTSGSDGVQVPGEVPNTSLQWGAGSKDSLSWSAAPGSGAYRLYRADQNELKNIGVSAKVCIAYQGDAPTSGHTLTAEPPSGSFYWYVAVAYNPTGEGSAGTGRILSSTGNCSSP